MMLDLGLPILSCQPIGFRSEPQVFRAAAHTCVEFQFGTANIEVTNCKSKFRHDFWIRSYLRNTPAGHSPAAPLSEFCTA